MEILRRAPIEPARLGVYPGAFNPPTRAHLALAGAALDVVDEVLFVMPRVLPHKTYEGVSLPHRMELLLGAIDDGPRFSAASTSRGLFIDIARECRAAYGPDADLLILCGRDAAERAVHWDYGRPGAFPEMLQEFELLVVSRGGEMTIPAGTGHRIHRLALPGDWDEVSATAVRERIREGLPWEHLVPAAIVPRVRELYGG